jgi:site-specific DNA-methyltransferase (adenine-specific)
MEAPDPSDEAKPRSPKNRTVTLTASERERYRARLRTLSAPVLLGEILDSTVLQDWFEAARFLPDGFVDLLFLDPPYNIDREFGSGVFKRRSADEYESWLAAAIEPAVRLLKDDATVYICGDWLSSASIYRAASRFFTVRSRITWEREKGRGAMSNWKSAAEDIWFCTKGNRYHFDAGAVRLRRRVIAPYRLEGEARDWTETPDGKYRDTAPSNFWSDVSVPFWSMPENTPHPTQKPEKLLARLILASSEPGGVVLDPFLGSGTASVVARKLGRRFVGIEREEEFALYAEKRLDMALSDPTIQGYEDGVFWERNTLNERKGRKTM